MALDRLLPWAAVALELPGATPEQYDLIDDVSHAYDPDGHAGHYWDRIPDRLVADLCTAVAIGRERRPARTAAPGNDMNQRRGRGGHQPGPRRQG
ncbi:hypothetical protein ACWIGI_11190 [Nocardia sp. NPDC055321]